MTISKTNKSVPGGKMPPTYEAALSELENLVQSLESGQVPLDELLVGYQRGAALLIFMLIAVIASLSLLLNRLASRASASNSRRRHWKHSRISVVPCSPTAPCPPSPSS